MEAQSIGQPKAVPVVVEQLRKYLEGLVSDLETLAQRLLPVLREVQMTEDEAPDENPPSCALQSELNVCRALVEKAQRMVLSITQRLEL